MKAGRQNYSHVRQVKLSFILSVHICYQPFLIVIYIKQNGIIIDFINILHRNLRCDKVISVYWELHLLKISTRFKKKQLCTLTITKESNHSSSSRSIAISSLSICRKTGTTPRLSNSSFCALVPCLINSHNVSAAWPQEKQSKICNESYLTITNYTHAKSGPMS